MEKITVLPLLDSLDMHKEHLLTSIILQKIQRQQLEGAADFGVPMMVCSKLRLFQLKITVNTVHCVTPSSSAAIMPQYSIVSCLK